MNIIRPKGRTVTIILDDSRENPLVIFSGFTGYSGQVCNEAAKPIVDAIGSEIPQKPKFGEEPTKQG